jgi:hypothetical protein
MLEMADRRWPVRRDAAFERARLAAEHAHDASTAVHWLTRCEGQLYSPLRWNQLAANIRFAIGDRSGAWGALSLSLALKPGSPSSHWSGAVDLGRDLNIPHRTALATQIRAQLWAQSEEH